MHHHAMKPFGLRVRIPFADPVGPKPFHLAPPSVAAQTDARFLQFRSRQLSQFSRPDLLVDRQLVVPRGCGSFLARLLHAELECQESRGYHASPDG